MTGQYSDHFLYLLSVSIYFHSSLPLPSSPSLFFFSRNADYTLKCQRGWAWHNELFFLTKLILFHREMCFVVYFYISRDVIRCETSRNRLNSNFYFILHNMLRVYICIHGIMRGFYYFAEKSINRSWFLNTNVKILIALTFNVRISHAYRYAIILRISIEMIYVKVLYYIL